MARIIYIRTPYTNLIQKATYVKKITDDFICVEDEYGSYAIVSTQYIVPKSEAIKEYKERIQREAITIVTRMQSHSIDIKDLIKELRCTKFQEMK